MKNDATIMFFCFFHMPILALPQYKIKGRLTKLQDKYKYQNFKIWTNSRIDFEKARSCTESYSDEHFQNIDDECAPDLEVITYVKYISISTDIRSHRTIPYSSNSQSS